MSKRLFRNTYKSSIGGVCAELSEYYDIDVTIFRLIFVIGTIFTVFPFILTYLIMWIIIPEKLFYVKFVFIRNYLYICIIN